MNFGNVAFDELAMVENKTENKDGNGKDGNGKAQ